MKVLLTGATGFVGSHTAKALLHQGHDVRALVRTPSKLQTVTARVGVDLDAIETVHGDITDAEAVAVAVAGCDAVVHAAAVVGTDPSSQAAIEATNFPGTLNVLGSAVDAGCDPVVYVSTAAALFPFTTAPVTGEHPVGTANSPYARTKALCEQLARRHQASGHGMVIIYPSMVVGPDDWNGSTQVEPVKLWVSKPFPRSDGYTLTLVDVRDIAAVVAAAMQPGRGPKRYVMFGHHLSSDELLAQLCSVTGRDLKSVTVPRVAFQLWGRIGDMARRFGRDLVLTTESVEYMFNNCAGDNSFTVSDTGVALRPTAESLSDTLGWMRDAGHISAEQAGLLGS